MMHAVWVGKLPQRVWQEHSDSGAAVRCLAWVGLLRWPPEPLTQAQEGVRASRPHSKARVPALRKHTCREPSRAGRPQRLPCWGSGNPHMGQGVTSPSYHQGERGGCPPQGRLQAQGEQGPWRKWGAALNGDRCRPNFSVSGWWPRGSPLGATLTPTGTQATA